MDFAPTISETRCAAGGGKSAITKAGLAISPEEDVPAKRQDEW